MYSQARAALLRWYGEHKRDLPWRRTRDPYAIWVSEVMLQQTRVQAVLEHYARWMERFPTVEALARAEEPEVLALWSGLGYYRRARMLHRAARAVVEEHGGELPRTSETLRTLPGVGAYTAAAVASIAFGEPIAVVDGNVERVMARVLGLRTPVPAKVQKGAARLLAPDRPADSNQAVMELGATVCLPRAPLCLHCPIQPWCKTRGEHPTAARKPLVAREIAYALVVRGDGCVLLQQRAADLSLMAGMWELPELAAVPPDMEPALRLRHSITVTNYSVSVVRVEEGMRFPGPLRWCAPNELPELALTGLARKVLRRLELWPSPATAASAAEGVVHAVAQDHEK